ncbi:hypothetical protein [Gulosibacter sediminis]|uniref:hypothetical protein n=1 Tax=Gulosibacter sediminis TaxID=1729695 RepID=UPI0024ACAF9B|nr:hypothetical protein [Gulosibacter sediminis]
MTKNNLARIFAVGAVAAHEYYTGRWCAAPDSPVDSGCITVEWPAATFDNGQVSVNLEFMNMDDFGCLVISQGDAPFGSFCPAGVELDLPNPSFLGRDYPEEDRLWNSQTGIMYLRD